MPWVSLRQFADHGNVVVCKLAVNNWLSRPLQSTHHVILERVIRAIRLMFTADGRTNSFSIIIIFAHCEHRLKVILAAHLLSLWIIDWNQLAGSCEVWCNSCPFHLVHSINELEISAPSSRSLGKLWSQNVHWSKRLPNNELDHLDKSVLASHWNFSNKQLGNLSIG